MAKVEHKNWSPQPGPQTEVLTRGEKEILFGGARYGGKTEAGLAWLAEPEYITNPMFRSLVIRKNYDDLADWIFRARVFYEGLCEITGTPAVIKWRAGGVTRLGHWADKSTISKYIGQEFHKILFEELNQSIATLDEYQMILGSCRSTVEGLRAQIFCTANPGGIGHAWIKKYFVDMARNKSFKDPKTGYTRIYIPSSYKDNRIGCERDPEYIGWLQGLEGTQGRAWRDGDWDAYSGQYFGNFGSHLAEVPFDIPPHVAERKLVLSFDYGYGLNGKSSAGLWFIDGDKVPHRLFTWYRTGLTATEQADDLYDYVASFPHTSGVMPITFVYDNCMDNRSGLKNDDWAPIDYFKSKFKRHGTQFKPANKARVNGWQIMIDYFSCDAATGKPKMRYWDKYNASFVECIPLMIADDNNPDDVHKCDVDHPADECRYGLVEIRSAMNSFVNTFGTVQSYNDLSLICNRELVGQTTETGW